MSQIVTSGNKMLQKYVWTCQKMLRGLSYKKRTCQKLLRGLFYKKRRFKHPKVWDVWNINPEFETFHIVAKRPKLLQWPKLLEVWNALFIGETSEWNLTTALNSVPGRWLSWRRRRCRGGTDRWPRDPRTPRWSGESTWFRTMLKLSAIFTQHYRVRRWLGLKVW